MPNHIVYVLENLQGDLYIGSTTSIEHRLLQHNQGKTRTTKYAAPYWEVIHTWDCDSEETARTWEFWLHRLSHCDILSAILDCAFVDYAIVAQWRDHKWPTEFSNGLKKAPANDPLPELKPLSLSYRTDALR